MIRQNCFLAVVLAGAPLSSHVFAEESEGAYITIPGVQFEVSTEYEPSKKTYEAAVQDKLNALEEQGGAEAMFNELDQPVRTDKTRTIYGGSWAGVGAGVWHENSPTTRSAAEAALFQHELKQE